MKSRTAGLSQLRNLLSPCALRPGLGRWLAFPTRLAHRWLRRDSRLTHLQALVARHTDCAIIITDAQARVQWVNPAFTRLTGFELSEVVGQKAGRAQQGPDTSAEVRQTMRLAIARGEGFHVEVLNYARDGQAYWVDIEAQPIHNARGQVEHFIATQRVVTAQRHQTQRLEQSRQSAEVLASELAASRQQLRMAADAGGLSLWDWDLVNDRFWFSSHSFPVADEQWIENCGLWDLFTLAHEEDFPKVEKTISALLSAESLQINELFRVQLAGKWRWVSFRGAVSQRNEEGKPVRVSGTLLDETDRIQAQECARADRDLLQCVIRHIPHAVYWKDQQHRYLGCNRRFAESLGLASEADVIGRLDGELQSSSKVAQAIADSDHRIVETGQEINALPQTIVEADGSRREILCSKVPLRTQSGAIFGMLGVFDDITEQKRLERQLADSRQLESLGRLAAGIAHEINTPMQYIGDNIEFLSESTAQIFELFDRVQAQLASTSQPKLPSSAAVGKGAMTDKQMMFIREQVPRAIQDCLDGSRRVIEIVNAMKFYSHPGSNRFADANVNDLIHSTASITRNRWKHCATLELNLASDLPTVPCLPAEINQVILNLIINAADAVVERFGESTTVRGAIVIATQRTAGGIAIEVRDNGCGIPEANLSRVFDPFYTTKGVGKGTGQGLTLCYAVVCNKHGGTLSVSSRVGEGTTFRVVLPENPCPIHEASESSDASLVSSPQTP